jgi:hypothetical protein
MARQARHALRVQSLGAQSTGERVETPKTPEEAWKQLVRPHEAPDVIPKVRAQMAWVLLQLSGRLHAERGKGSSHDV